MNTPFGNSVTTAEHAIAMMMALARQLPLAKPRRMLANGKSPLYGNGDCRQNLGLIGCGNIGSIVADRAHGLKMRVVVFDPFLSAERAADLGIEKVEFETLLARADVISIHAPLTDATRDLFNANAFSRMKDGVRIVNCARGGMSLKPISATPESGKVAGAAIDVFAEEPANENILFGLPTWSPRLIWALRRRSAGKRRAAGGGTDVRLFADRRGFQCDQYAVGDGGRGASI